jgi:hypothetical protein
MPLAITLMIVVSKLPRRNSCRHPMKMLVLHAEKLGLKQEYIQEHRGH